MDTCPERPEVKPQRRGSRPRKDGTVVVRYWCPQDGGHSLKEVELAPTPRRRRMRNKPPNQMWCPNQAHRDAKVVKNGTQPSKAGLGQRWLCVRPEGSTHSFQTLKAADGSILVSTTPAPECPYREVSHVVRDGKRRSTKAKSDNTTVRQNYLCVPADGSAPHRFVPPMPRGVVQVGQDSCTECEEVLSPHRGV